MADSRQSENLERPSEESRSAHLTATAVRLMIIGIVLSGAIIFGFYFKSRANPGTEPSSFGTQPPQYINVFESNPAIPVTVSVEFKQYYIDPAMYNVTLHAEGFTEFLEGVGVTASPPPSVSPGTIMITSSTEPEMGASSIAAGLPPNEKQASVKIRNGYGEKKFAFPVTLSRDSDGTWSGGVDFGLVPIIFQDNGSVFGHLPSVGNDEFTSGGLPPLFVEYEHTTGKIRYATVDTIPNLPPGAKLADPSLWVTIHGDQGMLFNDPENISYSEGISKIAPALRSQLVDFVTPSMSVVDNSDYDWNSKFPLEPLFKDTDPDAAGSESQAAFYAGIAFGVAGSAAIALVQEIRPRNRKPPKSSARGLASGHSA